MLAAFGKPGQLTTECSPVTNAALAKLMVTTNVGPFMVHGLKPAVEALARVFADIKAHKPDVHAALTTAGMTCCRAVRGSKTNFSNHSWGTAIDLSIHGHLTPLGSPTVQRGMVEAAPFFAKEKFFWGGRLPHARGRHALRGVQRAAARLESAREDSVRPDGGGKRSYAAP
jgi:hypothetical protein